MATVFLAPKAFTPISQSEQAQAPVTNLLRDEAGRVWRSNGLTGVTMTVQLDGTPWDTLALVNTNLRATDTIRVRAGASTTVVNGSTGAPIDVTFNAWTGTAPLAKATAFRLLTSAVTYAFVRLDITSTGNPDGYVQASNLVIGKRVETAGVNIGAERQHMDGSVVADGPGFTTVQEYRRRLQWKVSIGPLTATSYYAEWDRFLYQVGRSRGFLFIEDTNAPWVQSELAFVRNQADAKSVNVSTNYAKLEMTLLQV